TDDHGILWKSSKKEGSGCPSQATQEKRHPDTELDLYEYFAVKDRMSEENSNDKKVVSTYKTSVMSQDSNGIVTNMTVEELHFSDGSVERVESTNGEESRQILRPSTHDAPRGLTSPPFNGMARFHDAFEKERQKIREQNSAERVKCPGVDRDSKPI